MFQLPGPLSSHSKTAFSKCNDYIRKLFKFNQMDFQFAFWQMTYLFIGPQKLSKLFRARKNSKSQYARDDPAFLVLLSAWLCVTSIGFAFVLKLSFVQFLKFLIFVIFVDCIIIGGLVATIFWYLTNRFLKPRNDLEGIEWGYAFDIHLNAFFPPLILLHFIQLFFYNGLISHEWFISVLLGNAFWLLAASYYLFITFLGYDSIQILNYTHVFLIPIPWVFAAFCCSLILGVNISQNVMNFYKYRVV